MGSAQLLSQSLPSIPLLPYLVPPTPTRIPGGLTLNGMLGEEGWLRAIPTSPGTPSQP